MQLIQQALQDSLGNVANASRILYKDSIGPDITIINPNNNKDLTRDAPFFEISIIEANSANQFYF